MPTVIYMSIEQAKEEIRQREVTERIRRFATPDPEVAKKRASEGWEVGDWSEQEISRLRQENESLRAELKRAQMPCGCERYRQLT